MIAMFLFEVLQQFNVRFGFLGAQNLAQARPAKQYASDTAIILETVFIGLTAAFSAVESRPIQQSSVCPCTVEIETGIGNTFQTLGRSAVEDPPLEHSIVQLWEMCGRFVQKTRPHVRSENLV
jgi:hypothetical protein